MKLKADILLTTQLSPMIDYSNMLPYDDVYLYIIQVYNLFTNFNSRLNFVTI